MTDSAHCSKSGWGGRDTGTRRHDSSRATKSASTSQGFWERGASAGTPGGATPGSGPAWVRARGQGHEQCDHRAGSFHGRPYREKALERQLWGTPGKPDYGYFPGIISLNAPTPSLRLSQERCISLTPKPCAGSGVDVPLLKFCRKLPQLCKPQFPRLQNGHTNDTNTY